jgi:UDPglucose--hexose-1-phosphate uridylyltransferase
MDSMERPFGPATHNIMSEIRQNIATKEWVVISTERAKRPDQFKRVQNGMTHTRASHEHSCPFCPGNENQTTPTILQLPAQGDWQARIFKNKYPALDAQGRAITCLEGVHRHISGVGSHEVLVESPRHNMTPAVMDPKRLGASIMLMRDRGRELFMRHEIEHVIYFKNHGQAAGSSIEHTHIQLVALPIVPYHIRLEIEEIRRTVNEEGGCAYCRMIALEKSDGERVVCENTHFIAIVPFAAPSPFYTLILPKRHSPNFLDLMRNEIESLADMMRIVLAKIYYGLGDPDHNYVVKTAPFRDASSNYLHWYIEVVPRVTRDAGFELGTGMYINPSMPEDCAAFLRDQDPGQPLPVEAPEYHHSDTA